MPVSPAESPKIPSGCGFRYSGNEVGIGSVEVGVEKALEFRVGSGEVQQCGQCLAELRFDLFAHWQVFGWNLQRRQL